MTDLVQTSRDGGALVLRMNRPEKKNALSRAMYAAMSEAIAHAEADAETGAIVFLGGPGAFSAGNDLADFAAMARTGEMPSEVRLFLHALAGAGKPIVAGVDGLAIGIGTTMLFHCDLVLATPQSEFRTPFVDLGLTPEAGSSLIAPRLMGAQRAFQMLAMGRLFDARSARDCGFVTEIVNEDLEGSAIHAAQVIAAKPASAVRAAKRLIRGDTAEIHERIDAEIEIFAEHLRSPEAVAAFEAFFRRGKEG